MKSNKITNIIVVGLGYVGLPLAVRLATAYQVKGERRHGVVRS